MIGQAIAEVKAVSGWLLPTLSEILAAGEPTTTPATALGAAIAPHVLPPQDEGSGIDPQTARAEREWSGAIIALNHLLQAELEPSATKPAGFILSGPTAVLTQPELTERFRSWVFTSKLLNALSWLPLQLLPAMQDPEKSAHPASSTLPLLPIDPLVDEQFCLVMTTRFSLVMVLGDGGSGQPYFRFSFEPEVIERVWKALKPRIRLTSPHHLSRIESLLDQYVPTPPDYKIVMQFSRFLLQHLPDPVLLRPETSGNAMAPETSELTVTLDAPPSDLNETADVELLKAIAHEVRTPLSTIRTLTRLLLRRQDLSPEVIKRLEVIDRECSDQIDRFGLIFKAVELETGSVKQAALPLTPTPLDQVFQQSIPRWQQQASQRGLTLEMLMPPQMPKVVSDPVMLDQALTGIIERFTRSLPTGSRIQVQVGLAGSQLKLQFQADPGHPEEAALQPTLKALGQLLMFQPETGSLSLNMAVTKNLFQALGGKLIVRQRPQQGEVLTIFLPLETKGPDIRTV